VGWCDDFLHQRWRVGYIGVWRSVLSTLVSNEEAWLLSVVARERGVWQGAQRCIMRNCIFRRNQQYGASFEIVEDKALITSSRETLVGG